MPEWRFAPIARNVSRADYLSMDTTPYWFASVPLPGFPPLVRDVSVDAIVIGGGLTGITAAYLFKRAGMSVALLERGRCAEGDTGHTSAHLTAVTDMRLHTLISDFGEAAARTVWDAGMSAVALIADVVARENIKCDFSLQNGYLHAPARSDDGALAGAVSELQLEAEAAKQLGIPVESVGRVPLFATPGIRFSGQAKFHPRKYLAALLSKIRGDGSCIFENTNADTVSTDPLTVTAGDFTVRGRFLVIATHTPLRGSASGAGALLFQSKLSHYTSYAIRGRFRRENIPDGIFWDTDDPYGYLRIDDAGDPQTACAIYGGQDHKTGQVSSTEARYHALERRLSSLMPAGEITHRWSGQVVETIDGLPYIGPVDKEQFVATGFGGNGMTFGTLAATMALDAAQGRENRWSKLFDIHRKKLIGDAWTYFSENKDYPLHLIHDWFSKGDQGSFNSLPRENGRVFQMGRRRVAAYRAQDGTLTVCSAVCPHMGCTVRWNEAEKTWDCPCLGSRFRATGEVLAGPAEESLEPLAASSVEAPSSESR
ncbi:hypothetical protein AW736_12180 [Termitidicoccus mucosus]|uniref:Rieske domain-containing protein n=2 Tax=Termitidicoccus mucosus TaxID=1184151 RepID=A0A178IKE3_9BACT|nr:hypothetical protein AW736_12180 [Opitutaceae bacterium TSB47]